MLESKSAPANIMSETNINARFDEIYDSTNKYILAFITAKCGNTADISDIFQETYMELYQRLKKRGADYITDGKAFAVHIAKHKIARHYTIAERLRMFVSMTGKNEDGEADISDTDIDLFLAEDNMEDFVVNQILLENSRKFIQQKPEDIKKIFYLFYDIGLTIPEIAKKLLLTESNVKNKLYRTVKELQNLIEKGG